MKQSIASLFELYLERADLRPASIRFKNKSLEYFLEWFGDMPIGRVTPAMAEDYRTLLAKGRSKRSANGYLANFKPFWSWLYKHNRISGNPFDSIRLYKITDVRRETFSQEELSRLMRISSILWRVRTCLGLLGMRRGEMLNLRRDNIRVSVENPHILLCPSKATDQTWPWDIKDHAVRYVALPERMSFLDIVVNLHSDITKLMRQPWPYVCLEEKYWQNLLKLQSEKQLWDTHIANPPGNFQRQFRALQKRAGIATPRRYHELRAAFITQMIENTDLSRAADAAGHSSVSTTKLYHRYSQMTLVAEMAKVAEKCYGSDVP